MKPLFILIILIFCFLPEAKCQIRSYDNIGKNGIYVESYLLRHDFSDGFVSINGERYLGRKKIIALRLGVYPDFESTVSFPLTISWVIAPLKNHHLEYGIGIVYRLEFYESQIYKDIAALMIPVMYRYQKANGFFIRAGVNLFVSWPTLLSPSLCVGYKF